jgi:hypothetical protein
MALPLVALRGSFVALVATKNPPAAGLKQSITISGKDYRPSSARSNQREHCWAAAKAGGSAKKERAPAPEWPETDARCAVNSVDARGSKSRAGVSDAGRPDQCTLTA